MVSKSGISSSESTNSQEEQGRDVMANLSYKLNLMKKKIQSERVVSIGEKLEKNSKRIQAYASELETLAASRTDFTDIRSSDSVNLLSLRMDNPLCKVGGLIQSPADRDDVNSEDFVFSSTAKLPKLTAERMPPYTTWIFLDRNQRMADDQSVAGRRRIYYAQHGGEALVCSDSEEDLGHLEGQKHEFSEGEDRIMREAFQEYGVTDEVLDTLTQFIGGTLLEIQERCNKLNEKDQIIEKQKSKSSTEAKPEDNVFLDKIFGAAIDSFDNLFCRRCLVFDCRLHGCSQNLIYPSENQTYPSDLEDRKPCGSQCYLQLNDPKVLPKGPAVDPLDRAQSKASDEEERTTFSSYHTEQAHYLESKEKLKASKLVSEDLLNSSSKKLNLAEFGGSNECEVQMSTDDSVHTLQVENVNELDVTVTKVVIALSDKEEDEAELPLNQACNSLVKRKHGRSKWRSFEKDLYLKGLEIFGRNSCFIARNLLSGLKTCKEVSRYMYGDGVFFPRGSSTILSSLFEDGGKTEMENMGPEMSMKSRMCRKRGRTRKIKSSWKSAGHPSLWRRIADGKNEPYKQYVPCTCESSCGKQCSCLQIGTCCEKYCGCSKGCKNRFRGCHCAKSQCKSRQCPCFAAGRECDPDVCRNCWVSCGDGSLGEPPRRGEGQCGNMKLLLRQQQRILLTKSDIAGWGAFLKNPVNKNDYLGEYTGELISHREADRRGKIYDRVNSSFLFDLNDQYVLDAYRKGDKLKFANHSSTPNCYAKVMLVAGDHRVGIFANEHIEAGEELFYDYRYGPDQAPAWALKPEGSKRDGSPIIQGRRAKKHQTG